MPNDIQSLAHQAIHSFSIFCWSVPLSMPQSCSSPCCSGFAYMRGFSLVPSVNAQDFLCSNTISLSTFYTHFCSFVAHKWLLIPTENEHLLHQPCANSPPRAFYTTLFLVCIFSTFSLIENLRWIPWLFIMQEGKWSLSWTSNNIGYKWQAKGSHSPLTGSAPCL